jgi:hypothetical protein
MQLSGDPGPRTIAATTAISQVIVVGTFKGFGTARWNTPGGVRPTSAEFSSTSAVLERPASIAVETMLRGSTALVQNAVVRGGKSGCDSTVADTPALHVGSRYVFFLFPILDSHENPGPDLLVIEAWPVSPSNVVQTRQDGPVPLSQISTAASQPIPSAAP